MTVTVLPTTQQIHDDAVRQNFEYIENHGLFDKTAEGVKNVAGPAQKWHDIPFNATNWQNFVAVVVPANGVHFQYSLDALGFVHVRGFIKSVAGYVFATPSTLIIGTLPPGARPGAEEPGLLYQQDGTPSQTIARLNVLATDGTIRLAGDAITGPANNGVVAFGVLVIPPFQQVN